MSLSNDSPPGHTFYLGPFRFLSALDIPELRNLTGPGTIPVTIQLGPTSEALPGARPYGPLCQVSPSEYLLNIPNVARYHAAEGSRVRIHLYPGAPAADVSAFLLGSVFGALCHQNRLLPLHASAVSISGQATAFLGESGAGKSTLAACLQSRGLPIISDDICLLAPPPTPHIIPVAGWLKLWRQSLDHLGQTPNELNRVFAADDKFRLYLTPPATSQPATLRNLIFLARAPSPTDTARLQPLSTAETIALMLRLTYLGYITELTGSHARVFAHCAAILQHARGFRLTLPWNLTRIDEVLDLLEPTLSLHP